MTPDSRRREVAADELIYVKIFDGVHVGATGSRIGLRTRLSARPGLITAACLVLGYWAWRLATPPPPPLPSATVPPPPAVGEDEAGAPDDDTRAAQEEPSGTHEAAAGDDVAADGEIETAFKIWVILYAIIFLLVVVFW